MRRSPHPPSGLAPVVEGGDLALRVCESATATAMMVSGVLEVGSVHRVVLARGTCVMP